MKISCVVKGGDGMSLVAPGGGGFRVGLGWVLEG